MLVTKKTVINEENPVLVFKAVNFGTGYYYAGVQAEGVEQNINAEIRLDKPDGELAGTITITGNGNFEYGIRNAKGKRDVYIVFKNATSKLQVEKFRFFAGSPSK